MEVPKDMTIPQTNMGNEYIGCSPLTPCSNQSEVNTPTNVIDAAASCDDHYTDYPNAPTSLQTPVDLVLTSREENPQNPSTEINDSYTFVKENRSTGEPGRDNFKSIVSTLKLFRLPRDFIVNRDLSQRR